MRYPILPVLAALTAIVAAFAPSVRAGRPVPVYDVTVRGEDQSTVFGEAMKEALVRATGRKDAASDPAFAGLVMNAAQYVRSSRPAGEGQLEVSFDGAAVERQIVADGRSVWDANRPFTLVVLSPPPTGAADEETRSELEQVAERRGLPVSLVPIPATDQNGNPLSADALLTDARRLGGDAVLLGRADPPGQSAVWQWTLITGLTTQGWNGTLDAGIDGAADALARVEGSALPLAEEEVLVRVSGVSTLADYAAVERTLGELPGARRSGVEQADGASATFSVLIRGGAQAVERALAASQHFSRQDSEAGSLPAGSGAPEAGSAEGSVAAPLTYAYHP